MEFTLEELRILINMTAGHRYSTEAHTPGFSAIDSIYKKLQKELMGLSMGLGHKKETVKPSKKTKTKAMKRIVVPEKDEKTIGVNELQIPNLILIKNSSGFIGSITMRNGEYAVLMDGDMNCISLSSTNDLTDYIKASFYQFYLVD